MKHLNVFLFSILFLNQSLVLAEDASKSPSEYISIAKQSCLEAAESERNVIQEMSYKPLALKTGKFLSSLSAEKLTILRELKVNSNEYIEKSALLFSSKEQLIVLSKKLNESYTLKTQNKTEESQKNYFDLLIQVDQLQRNIVELNSILSETNKKLTQGSIDFDYSIFNPNDKENKLEDINIYSNISSCFRRDDKYYKIDTNDNNLNYENSRIKNCVESASRIRLNSEFNSTKAILNLNIIDKINPDISIKINLLDIKNIEYSHYNIIEESISKTLAKYPDCRLFLNQNDTKLKNLGKMILDLQTDFNI
jgi:hypothetical protein